MPGGKVVVYSGLLPVAKDDDGLAVVMGHEIAHAIANHGNERMSQGLIAQGGGLALSTALKNKPTETQNLFNQAYGVTAQVGAVLPFSRLQESEADRLGLIFMAMAGYNPEAAIPFWERMSKSSTGSAPPALLSTHPSNATRIQKLKAAIPEAKTYALKYGKK
jgi:predicted Zn-dependent protease